MGKRRYADYDGKSVPTVAQQNAKPNDIPRDVWTVGVTMALEYVEWLEAGNSVGMLSEHAEAAMADTISRAIMAEREACALVADAEADNRKRSQEAAMAIGEAELHLLQAVLAQQSKKIATAIRNGRVS